MGDITGPEPFEVEAGGVTIAGETVGDGPDVVLMHGLTATRHYTVMGSKALPRAGYRLTTFDARGHGESSPAPDRRGDEEPGKGEEPRARPGPLRPRRPAPRGAAVGAATP